VEIYAYIANKRFSKEEYILAKNANINLVWVGDCDCDPFTVSWEWVMNRWYDHFAELSSVEEAEYIAEDRFQFDGVVATHPATALNLITETSIGVFDSNASDASWFKIFE